MKSNVILGPPGTGKTTAGTMLAKGWFDAGATPDEVAYLAFTKAAARAACTKIVSSEEEIDPDTLKGQFPLFRTIHSLAYMGLRAAKTDMKVLTPADLKKFSRDTGYEGKFSVQPWEDLGDAYQFDGEGSSHWDKAMAAYNLSRASARTVEELDAVRTKPSKIANETVGYLEEEVYRAFVVRYEAFKKAEGLVDFTDMLEFALRSMPPLDSCRYVIVDEAQDLAPILHAIVDRLFRNAEEIWWIGDDDQAIFRFAAASADLFIERVQKADHRILLRQTHRFGMGIVEFSRKIITRIRGRVDKEIVGVSGRDGGAFDVGEFTPVAGNVLVMHRHVAGCRAVAKMYMEAGVPFRNERGRDPLSAVSRIKAWRAIDGLSKGARVQFGLAQILITDLMPSFHISEDGASRTRLVTHGAKSKVDRTIRESINLSELTQLGILTEDGAKAVRQRQYQMFKNGDDLEYYDRVIENGYRLDDRGATITTGHGSKGRQAESSIVFREMTRRCWDDPDTEHRLAYVMATRTRSDVTICTLRTEDWMTSEYDYPILETERR